MSDRETVLAGVRWTTFSSAGRLALQVVQLLVLARILTPADFGLVAVALALLAILQLISDGGLSTAIIHYQEIPDRAADSLFWTNLILSASIALSALLGGGVVGRWYHRPDLGPLVRLAGCSIFATAVGQHVRARAQRDFRFAGLAKGDFAGAIGGAFASIALAIAGWGAKALLVGNVVAACITTAAAWAMLADGWRPGRHVSWLEARPYMRFGMLLVGDSLVTSLSSQVDILVGGRMLTARTLGLYSVARDLSLRLSALVNPIITQVSFPLIARSQSDISRLRVVYLQMLRMLASVTFPIYIALGTFAPEIVQIVLGEKWLPAVPAVRILACWALVRSTGNPVGVLVKALGRAGLSLSWNIGVFLATIAFVVPAMRFGHLGVAFAMLALALTLFLPNWAILVRPLCGARLGEYVLQLAVPLSIAGAAGGVGFMAAGPFTDPLVRLICGGTTMAVLYLTASSRLNRSWWVAMADLTKPLIKATPTWARPR